MNNWTEPNADILEVLQVYYNQTEPTKEERIKKLTNELTIKKKEYEQVRLIRNNLLKKQQAKGVKTRPLIPPYEHTLEYKILKEDIERLTND